MGIPNREEEEEVRRTQVPVDFGTLLRETEGGGDWSAAPRAWPISDPQSSPRLGTKPPQPPHSTSTDSPRHLTPAVTWYACLTSLEKGEESGAKSRIQAG